MMELVVPLDSKESTDARRFGPKAAHLAALSQAGLPVPGGYCVDADAYRVQMRALGLESSARAVFATDGFDSRRHALDIKLALLNYPVEPALVRPLLGAWHASIESSRGGRGVVRSSASAEDRSDTSFAGQFESFLGLEDESEFLTAVRSCWCALWSSRALRYMASHDVDPADLAMGLVIQRLIEASVSGGALSRTAEGELLVTATRGPGSLVAQGQVVPDHYVMTREGVLRQAAAGRRFHTSECGHGPAVPKRDSIQPLCLEGDQLLDLGALLVRCEDVLGAPVEVEWTMEDSRFTLLQARPLHLETPRTPDAIWEQHPRLQGHPAGVGWGSGRARVVSCECELARVGPGDVLVTGVAGPSLSQILPRVSAVVAELGGSTSHLASLARERGIPLVLGVPGATRTIPDGSIVAVDGVAGIVRWLS